MPPLALRQMGQALEDCRASPSHEPPGCGVLRITGTIGATPRPARAKPEESSIHRSAEPHGHPVRRAGIHSRRGAPSLSISDRRPFTGWRNRWCIVRPLLRRLSPRREKWPVAMRPKPRGIGNTATREQLPRTSRTPEPQTKVHQPSTETSAPLASKGQSRAHRGSAADPMPTICQALDEVRGTITSPKPHPLPAALRKRYSRTEMSSHCRLPQECSSLAPIQPHYERAVYLFCCSRGGTFRA